MAEYIDRETAIFFVCDEACKQQEPCGIACAEIRAIRQVPTADVVEIVRCKDCRHSENDPKGTWCYNMRFYVPEMFYCANGERRTEDG